MAYDNKTKYNVIEEICNGKSSRDIQREYNIRPSTAMNWLRSFVENGPFDDKELTPNETAKFGSMKKCSIGLQNLETGSKNTILSHNLLNGLN